MSKFQRYKYLVQTLVIITITVVFFICANIMSSTFNNVLRIKNSTIGAERMVNLTHSMTRDYQIVFNNCNRLNTLITKNPDISIRELEDFIESKLMRPDLLAFFNNKNTSFVTAYVVAPEDVVSVIYPKDKKTTAALEFFTDSNSKHYEKLAKNNPSDVIVQGPVLSLKTHDSIVLNRQAVYVDGKYWGYIGVVVDFYKYLECVKLNFEDDLFLYAIRAAVHNGNNDFICGDNSLFTYNNKSIRQKSLFIGKQRWDISLKVKPRSESLDFYNTYYLVLAFMYVLTLVLSISLVEVVFKFKQVKSVDLLTNTLNHETFMQLVQKELKNSQEHALIVLELVHFKQVNNTFGYSTGDSVLLEISRTIGSIIGYNDKVCRIGAEILIFLKNIKTTIDVERVCSDITEKMSETMYINSYAVKQNCVLGSANTIEDGHDYRTLLHNLNEDLDKNRNQFKYQIKGKIKEEP